MEILKIIVLAIFVFETRGAVWDYSPTGSYGPAHWGGDCNTGSSQSPININIDTSSTQTDLSLGAFTFTNYDQTNKYSIVKNNGHTIQVDMSTTDVTISGGGLVNSDYQLAQFHFHWGTTSSSGSEHTLNNNPAPLEVHFVHYNKIHADIGAAVNVTNGLAVLGFMFQVQPCDNSALDFLFDQLTNVTNKDDTHTLPSAPAIDDMLGSVNRTKYVRYSGSLTTPGCYESVQWTVFTESIPISEAQLNKIRAMKSDTAGTTQIGFNNRPVQNLNTRIIKISYDPGVSAASVIVTNVILLILSIVYSLCY